ncbi:MAG: hypothetical protein AB7H80_06745 [Candidatus Kapaibacterium sp.]
MMNVTTIPAHFDGTKIVLDEPYTLEKDMRLLVAIVVENSGEEEASDWFRASREAMAKLQEDEPDYSNAVIIRSNPEYRGS